MESLSRVADAINNVEEVDLLKVLNVSCEECRRRKIKCDSKKPSCSFCCRKSRSCLYALNKKKQILSTQLVAKTVEKFEERIKTLEKFSVLYAHDEHSTINNTRSTGSTKFVGLGFESVPKDDVVDPNYSRYIAPCNDTQLYSPSQVVRDICLQLMESVKLNGNDQGWLNHHKSLLLSLCNSSPIVANSLCALTLCCNETSDAKTRSFQNQIATVFISNSKMLLTQKYGTASVELIQALLILSVVEYTRGDGLKCAMYVNSAIKYCHMLGLPSLDSYPRNDIHPNHLAIQRKIYWEVFFCDSCTSFMCARDPEIFEAGTTFLVDSNGNSLNVTLDDVDQKVIHTLMQDTDYMCRVVPTLRLKLIEILKLAYYYTRKLIENENNSQVYEDKINNLKLQLGYLAQLTSPNPLLNSNLNFDPSSRYSSLDIQASLVIYFNAAFLILNCPNLFTSKQIDLNKVDTNFSASNYILNSIDICRNNPSGRWLPALPYFVYLTGLFYYKCHQACFQVNYYKANLAKLQFEVAYNLLDQFVLTCPIADYYLQILIPVRRNLMYQHTKFHKESSNFELNFLRSQLSPTSSSSSSHNSFGIDSSTFSPTTDHFPANNNNGSFFQSPTQASHNDYHFS